MGNFAALTRLFPEHRPSMRLFSTWSSLILAIPAFAVEVGLSPFDATCFLCNGAILANASGGLPPYSYAWSPTPPNGQGTSGVSGLCPGEYAVVVTDGLGNTAQASVIINSLGGLGMNMYAPEARHDCGGACTGWAYIDQGVIGGTPPYNYDFPAPQYGWFGTNSVTFAGLCPGPTTITVTDANGCAGTILTYISSSPPGSPQILNIAPACGSAPNGSITMPGESGSGISFRVESATFDSIYEFGDDPGPYLLGGIPPGEHLVFYWWLHQGPNGEPMYAYCSEGTAFTIDPLPEPCGSVSGIVYNDADQDCTLDASDYRLPYRVLTIEPGPTYAITDNHGRYATTLVNGNYTLSQPLAEEAQLCPTSHPVPFALSGAAPEATIDLADSSLVPHDISVSMWTSDARPGFSTSVHIAVNNNSAYPSGAVDIALSFDPILLSPSPAGGQWSFPSIAPYAQVVVTFTAMVPANIALLGTTLNHGVAVTNSLNEINVINNHTATSVVVTGSYDPNDKIGRTSTDMAADIYFIDQDEWIDYTIRFQNTGTAAAETVVIRDTIAPDLDINSLRILGATHDFIPSFGADRALIFTFNNINLPDSTTDPAASQGSIHFRLKPVPEIEVGDMIQNTAGIYFDFNPPIITNTATHTVEISTGITPPPKSTLQLMPNPAHDRLFVTLAANNTGVAQILTIDGRMVQAPITRRVNSIEVDVHALSPGTYVVRTTEGSARFVKK